MKIIYNVNPLNSTIELDDKEKVVLWHKLKEEELIELLFGAHFYLERALDMFFVKSSEDMKRAIQELDPKYYFPEEDEKKSDLDKRVDLLYEHYLESLQDIHSGDCTCVPSSCSKCHAEKLVGVDTIPGLNKYEASKINSAVRAHGSLALAIKSLEEYDVSFDALSEEDKKQWNRGMFEKHTPRWKQEAANAAEWLKNYRNQHFPDDKIVD